MKIPSRKKTRVTLSIFPMDHDYFLSISFEAFLYIGESNSQNTKQQQNGGTTLFKEGHGTPHRSSNTEEGQQITRSQIRRCKLHIQKWTYCKKLHTSSQGVFPSSLVKSTSLLSSRRDSQPCSTLPCDYKTTAERSVNFS